MSGIWTVTRTITSVSPRTVMTAFSTVYRALITAAVMVPPTWVRAGLINYQTVSVSPRNRVYTCLHEIIIAMGILIDNKMSRIPSGNAKSIRANKGYRPKEILPSMIGPIWISMLRFSGRKSRTDSRERKGAVLREVRGKMPREAPMEARARPRSGSPLSWWSMTQMTTKMQIA